METLPTLDIMGLAACAAAMVWALKMARSGRKAERESLGLQQTADSPADVDVASISTAETSRKWWQTDADDEGPARYYVKRPSSESSVTAEPPK